MTDSTARLIAIFTGRVQGMGFRATARHVARQFDVTGFVRNEADGRVRLVAEGSRAELDALLRGVQHELGGFITATDVEWISATGEFSDFGVAR